MARQAGPHFIIGRIGNLVYYVRDGVHLVKEISPTLSKEMKRGKNYQKTRESNVEFGGGSLMSKVFRSTFALFIEPYNDAGLAGRLTGIFRRVILMGEGKEGKRSMDIGRNRHLIEGFNFHKRNVFDEIFKPALQIKKGRKGIDLTVQPFTFKSNVSRPAGATHYKLGMMAAVFPDCVYSKKLKKYVAGSVEEMSAVVYSDFMAVKNSSTGIDLSAQFKSALKSDAVIVLIEIQFYKEECGQMYALETKRAMKVAGVF